MRASPRSYQKAAKTYMPDKTRILFVAEAPPLSINRYFYFEEVESSDWLWIALMRELFYSEWGQTRLERRWKRYWLMKFQKNGYRLIDAVKERIGGSHAARVQKIQAAAAGLVSEIRRIKPKRIILIKTTVHEVLFPRLRDAHLEVANQKPLPFPGFGRQKEFHRKFRREWLDCPF